jgi:ABC-type uncharacterized transport system substrate-binding protein
LKSYKIKKAVSKKAKKVKELIKTSSENINSKSYVDMIFQDGEKTRCRPSPSCRSSA